MLVFSYSVFLAFLRRKDIVLALFPVATAHVGGERLVEYDVPFVVFLDGFAIQTLGIDLDRLEMLGGQVSSGVNLFHSADSFLEVCEIRKKMETGKNLQEKNDEGSGFSLKNLSVSRIIRIFVAN